MANKKYMDVDVLAFLENIMKSNTTHYQSDFDIDKVIIAEAAASDRREDKTLLWMSRESGTQCNLESEAFVSPSYANTVWLYYHDIDRDDDVKTYTVEVSGIKDDVIRGNIYELDYHELVEVMKKNALPARCVEKTFEDGYVVQADPQRSSYGFWKDHIEQHGAIIHSSVVPEDKAALHEILYERKRARNRMKEEGILGFAKGKKRQSLKDQLRDAETRASISAKYSSEKKVQSSIQK